INTTPGGSIDSAPRRTRAPSYRQETAFDVLNCATPPLCAPFARERAWSRALRTVYLSATGLPKSEAPGWGARLAAKREEAGIRKVGGTGHLKRPLPIGAVWTHSQVCPVGSQSRCGRASPAFRDGLCPRAKAHRKRR